MTLSEYLDLITSQHRNKPKFSGVTASAVAPLALCQGFIDTSLLRAWDLDTAIGKQLDHVAEWIGATRYIEQPLLDLYFTWDDRVITGWEHGYWQGKYDPSTGVIALGDDVFRTVLYAKIASNNWNGSRETMEGIWNSAFGDESTLAVIDHQDMSITLYLQGFTNNPMLEFILKSGRIPLKPEGVRIREYIITKGAVFGFDSNSLAVRGFDIGYWGTPITERSGG